jgi:phosphoserine phosphatase
MLESKGWARCNHRFLHKWLLEQEAKRFPEVAVFDFDNTCIFGDIGEAVLRWQLEHKAFRFDAHRLLEMLTPPPNAPVMLRDKTPLLPFFAQMIDNFERMMAKDKDAQHHFLIQMFHLYNEGTVTEGLGAPYTYFLCAQLLSGYQIEEVHKLVNHVAAQEGIHAGKTKIWRNDNHKMMGPQKVQYKMGIKAQPEIIDLMKALKRARVTPHIVTASCQHIVTPLLRLWKYPVSPMHLFGIRQQTLGDKLTEIPMPNYPLPIEHGKVELIRQELSQEPILVAGDSSNDLPMLTSFETTEIRLIMHRPNKGLDHLYSAAVQDGQPAKQLPATILQGRDEKTGKFNRATLSSALS